MSMRLRLASAIGLAMTVVLAAYAVSVAWLVSENLHETLDAQVLEDHHDIERQLVLNEGRPDWSGTSPLIHDVPEPNVMVEVTTDEGVLVHRHWPTWFDTHDHERARVALRDTAPGFATLHTRGGAPVRVFHGTHRVRLTEGGTTLLHVVTGRDASPRDSRRRELWWMLFLALPVAALVAASATYAISTRALAPVDAMNERARAISAERLGERLPVGNRDDELSRLAATFNDTFSRLERSFDQLSRFASDASHELRTPLTALRAVGEATLRNAAVDDATRDAVGSMLEEVDRMTWLVDALLELARADAAAPSVAPAGSAATPIRLDGLVRDALESVQVLAEEKDQSVVVDVASETEVSLDIQRAAVALRNLVDNAIRYSPSGSTISIRATVENGQARIAVTDQGPGIDEHERELVFERFHRGLTHEPGVGLGLPIARSLARAAGGDVLLEDSSASGSRFVLCVPTLDARSALLARSPA